MLKLSDNWNATEDCLEDGALYRLTFETTYDDGDTIKHASCTVAVFEDEDDGEYCVRVDDEPVVERFQELEPAVYRMHELVKNLTEL